MRFSGSEEVLIARWSVCQPAGAQPAVRISYKKALAIIMESQSVTGEVTDGVAEVDQLEMKRTSAWAGTQHPIQSRTLCEPAGEAQLPWRTCGNRGVPPDIFQK